jgi:hypothetical protein
MLGKYIKTNHKAQFEVSCPYCMVTIGNPCKVIYDIEPSIHLERIHSYVAKKGGLIYLKPENN